MQKALAHLGLGSRREIEDWIRAGRLTVNGAPAALGTRVRETDRIQLDGRLVRQRPAAAHQVFICHRSPGEPLDGTAARSALRTLQRSPSDADQPPRESAPAPRAEADALPRQALLERLPRAGGRRFIAVSPMPHQDGGLELVTSDGEIAERLQRSVRGLSGEFSVRLRGELDDPQLASVRSGLLDSGHRLDVLDCAARGGEGANHWYALSVRGASGKDVRQLFERSGAIVSRVLRTRLGGISLDRTLSRGRFRRLTDGEVQALLGGREAREPRQRARPTARRSSRR